MCVHPRHVDRRRCDRQARLSISFVDHTVNLPWRKFLSPEVRTKFQTEISLFLEYLNFLITQWSLPTALTKGKTTLDRAN